MKGTLSLSRPSCDAMPWSSIHNYDIHVILFLQTSYTPICYYCLMVTYLVLLLMAICMILCPTVLAHLFFIYARWQSTMMIFTSQYLVACGFRCYTRAPCNFCFAAYWMRKIIWKSNLPLQLIDAWPEENLITYLYRILP